MWHVLIFLKVGLRILGVVENMSIFICPKCKIPSQILPASSGGAEKLCQDHDFKLLGKIPLNPLVGKTCDEGEDIFETDSPVTEAFGKVIDELKNVL